MEEFLAKGYAAASMDRVATAAKVSKATVYSHFQDKESLFNALIQRLVQKKFQSIVAAPDPQVLMQEEPRQVLHQIATRALTNSFCDPVYLNFMRLIVGESGRFPQLAQTFVRNLDQVGYQLLCEYFKSCPKLKVADPEATARVFMGALAHFIIVQEMLHGRDIMPLECDRLVETLVNLIVPETGQP